MTRGEMNNNPMNIRKSGNAWKGEVAGLDPEFEVFDNVENGIRAGAKLLLTYFDKYGLNTVHGIISRWAPSNENNTEAYIADVARRMAVLPDTPLNLHNRDTLSSMVMAIISHENGELIYSLDTILRGVDLALCH